MPRVRFDGPAHLLIVGDKTITRGGFHTFSGEDLKRLQSQKNIHLTVVAVEKPPQPQEPEAHEGEGQPAPNDQKE